MSDRPRPIVVTGAPGVGKSTTCRIIASRLTRAAHIEADELHRMIVAGAEWPSTGSREAHRQLLLRTRNATQLAANFARARIVPVIDEVIATREQLDIVDHLLGTADVAIVVLTAPVTTTLERDAGRDRHTAANYLGVDRLIDEVLADRATFVDSTRLSPEETARAVQAVVPDAGWSEA